VGVRTCRDYGHGACVDPPAALLRVRSNSALPVQIGLETGHQHAAQQPNRIVSPFTRNEGIPHLDSLAKNAVAFFKISHSILSVAFSDRRRATSLSSSSTGLRCGERNGRPVRVASTQLASDLIGIPSCRAALARPTDSDSATA